MVHFLVSVIVALRNSTSSGGYRSIAFSSIWTFFLALAFLYLGGIIVFNGKSPELLVGFMLGMSFMLSQLNLVLGVIVLGLGTEATTLGYRKFPISYIAIVRS